MNIEKATLIKSSRNLRHDVVTTDKQILVHYTSSPFTRFHTFGITKDNQIRINTTLTDSKKQTKEEEYITLVS